MPSERTLPNFIILGAAKAGTTALYHYLKQHPQITMSPLKETNFFALMNEPLDFCGPGDQDYINRFSITDLDGYLTQFQGCEGAKAIGEASPLYLYSPKAPPRIHEYVPDAKLIAILRNPVDRAYSAFLHLVRDGRETTRDFREALQREEERIAAGWEHIWHYKNMGRYYEQVKRYTDTFGRDRVRVFLYKDFRTNPTEMLGKVFRFLGVEDTFIPDMSARYNEASLPPEQRPPLLPEVRCELEKALREDILKTQDLIGRDLSHWLSMSSSEAEPKEQTS